MLIFCNNEEETKKAGFSFAQSLHAGDVICLSGDLGAGKTTFTKGIAQAFDSEFEPVSPTFNLVNVYPGKIPIYHFDLYRLSGIQDLLSIDFDSYLTGDGICVIEWPEISYPLLDRYYEVRFCYQEGGRTIDIKEVCS